MSPVRRYAAILLGIAMSTLSVAPAAAESALWSMTVSPLVGTVGRSADFTVTATNLDPLADLISSSRIGCVQVDVPANFSISTVLVLGSGRGSTWSATQTGNRVRVAASSGGDHLRTGEWVRFNVEATPTSTGSLAWSSRAFERTDCGGTGALLGVPPIVVVNPAAATPTPAPTPPPTPAPTAVPTPAPTLRPTPTPILPLPTSLPSLPPIGGSPSPSPSPSPSDRPGSERPSPSPSATPDDRTPGPDGTAPPASAAPTSDAAATADPSGGAGPGTGSSAPADPVGRPVTGPTVVLEPSDLALGGDAVGLLSSIDVWVVPGAAIAGPGLLILLWIVLQAVGAFAWLPAVRRLRGDEDAASSA